MFASGCELLGHTLCICSKSNLIFMVRKTVKHGGNRMNQDEIKACQCDDKRLHWRNSYMLKKNRTHTTAITYVA